MEVIEEKLLSLPFLNKTEYITLQLQKRGVKLEIPQPEDIQDAIEKPMTEEEKKAKLKADREQHAIAVAEERRKRKAEEDEDFVRIRDDAEKMVKSLQQPRHSKSRERGGGDEQDSIITGAMSSSLEGAGGKLKGKKKCWKGSDQVHTWGSDGLFCRREVARWRA